MKQWAEQFYNSRAWETTRDAFLLSKQYLCERCPAPEPASIAHHKIYLTAKNINDPAVALNFDNLEALCQDCHNKEHHRRKPTRRYRFDASGNILPLPPSKSVE